MKHYLQNKISELTFYLELIISILLSVVIVAMTIHLLIRVVPDYFYGNTMELDKFLAKTMTLAIGVEFVKMLCKHTPGTVIEVLLFAISRQMVVGHTGTIETLIGVIALAGLFATRKYLLFSLDEVEATLYKADRSVKLINRRSGLHLSEAHGATIGEAILKVLEEEEREPEVGTTVSIDGSRFRIESMKEGKIRRVEWLKRI